MTRVVRRSLVALALLALLVRVAPAQVRVGALGEGSYVQHRVDAGNGVELSSGTLFGGRLVGAWGRNVEVQIAAGSGTLTADSAQADDADLSRGEAIVTVLPVPWLGIRVGAERHTFTTPVVVQRWSAVRLGGEGRLRFTGGVVTGVLRFEFFPVVSVSGLERPNRAFSAASGLVVRSGIVTASLVYQLNRYDFPQVAAVERREQISYLVGSIGLVLGGSRR